MRSGDTYGSGVSKELWAYPPVDLNVTNLISYALLVHNTVRIHIPIESSPQEQPMFDRTHTAP